jgi:hypothetical protein
MVIGIVVLELIVSLVAALLIAVGNAADTQAAFPILVWLACAILQLAIHYLPRGRYERYGLLLVIALMLLAGAAPGKIEGVPYFHQSLFIAAVGTLPQLWWERFSNATKGHTLVLGLMGMLAMPLGFAAWSLANVSIVKYDASRVANGELYCIFVSEGRLMTGGYRQAPDDLSLGGWHMLSGRGGGGSGDCCQWDFHALLLTRDDRLFNWSYQSQRFERISERTRRLMASSFSNLKCQ